MSEPAERPSAEFDPYSRNYDEVVNSSIAFSGLKVDFFTRAKAAYLADIIAAQFPGRRDVRILDVGCGVGNYHPYLQGKVGLVDGVDVSEQSIETARQRNPAVNYKAYDGLRLPYDDDSFDVAYAICVVHHVPPEQWPQFARELHRVLRKGGLALIFEHNPLNPLTQRVVSNCEFDANAVLLKAPTTETLLTDAGFSDVGTRFILTVPAAGQMTRRIDGLFSRLPLGAQYYTRGEKR